SCSAWAGTPRADVTATAVPAPATRAPKSEATKRRVPRGVKGVVGKLVLLGVWESAGQAGVAKGTIPPPSDIVSSMVDDGWSFYWSNIKVTLSEAAGGYLWGNLLALGPALLALTR